VHDIQRGWDVNGNDDFIEGWYARLRGAVSDALAYLAACETSPSSDGVLGDWVDTLVALRFTASDIPFIGQLIDKRDPHLQEAGVRLATASLRGASASAFGQLEAPLARLTAQPIDSWVLESLVDLLAHTRRPMIPVYEGLVANHGKAPRGYGIMRNRHIEPWRRLVQHVYEQHALQTLRPQARDLVYLPILEREHGTHGWEPTVRAVLVRLGFEPEAHLERLRAMSL
jgi:hypothetical protein